MPQPIKELLTNFNKQSTILKLSIKYFNDNIPLDGGADSTKDVKSLKQEMIALYNSIKNVNNPTVNDNTTILEYIDILGTILSQKEFTGTILSQKKEIDEVKNVINKMQSVKNYLNFYGYFFYSLKRLNESLTKLQNILNIIQFNPDNIAYANYLKQKMNDIYQPMKNVIEPTTETVVNNTVLDYVNKLQNYLNDKDKIIQIINKNYNESFYRLIDEVCDDMIEKFIRELNKEEKIYLDHFKVNDPFANPEEAEYDEDFQEASTLDEDEKFEEFEGGKRSRRNRRRKLKKTHKRVKRHTKSKRKQRSRSRK